MYKYTRVNSTHENMLSAITSFALAPANLAVTSSVPAFLSIINAVKANLASVRTLRASITQSITGYTAQKKSAKTALIDISVTIMNAAYAYAVANSQLVLAAQMKISRSRLKDMKYVNLVSFAQGSIEIVTPLLPSLSDYGITPAMLTLWQSSRNTLNLLISNPKNAIANRAAVNKQIQSTLRLCMQFITDQADPLALIFKSTNEIYYTQYLSNRKLNPHHLSTQLRAHVQDELSQPLAGAIVSIDGTDLSSSTDTQGYCLIPNIPFGSHTLTVTTGNNVRTFGPYIFKKGKSLTLHFTTSPFVNIPATSARTSVELIH